MSYSIVVHSSAKIVALFEAWAIATLKADIENGAPILCSFDHPPMLESVLKFSASSAEAFATAVVSDRWRGREPLASEFREHFVSSSARFARGARVLSGGAISKAVLARLDARFSTATRRGPAGSLEYTEKVGTFEIVTSVKSGGAGRDLVYWQTVGRPGQQPVSHLQCLLRLWGLTGGCSWHVREHEHLERCIDSLISCVELFKDTFPWAELETACVPYTLTP